ncbi:hypothetical protein HHUSO_G35992 [Huso huso]|uniref:Ig-like domain-containing protein n=1 Tax=Huso huso TaxID=61971 RepID=A0ABR0Y309_HUSHU
MKISFIIWMFAITLPVDSSKKPQIIVNRAKSDEVFVQCSWAGEKNSNDTFVLFKNKEKVDETHSDTFHIKTETSNSGNYTCTVSRNGLSSNASASEQVTIIAPPVLSVSSSVSVRGADVTMQCSLSSSYQSTGWFILYRGSEEVQEQSVPVGDKSFTFTLTKIQEKQQGEYLCHYSTHSQTGWVLTEQSAPVNITVLDLPKPAISLETLLNPAGRNDITCSSARDYRNVTFYLHIQGESNHTEMKNAEASDNKVTFTDIKLTAGAYCTCWYEVLFLGKRFISPFSKRVPEVTEETELNTWIAIGVSSAAALMLLVCVAVLCVRRVKRGPTSRNTEMSQTQEEEEIVYASLNPSTLRKKDSTSVMQEEQAIYAAVVIK